MGNCSFKPDRDPNEVLCKDTPVVASKNQFLSLYVIGKGGFGRVWKVQDKKSDHQYAMKEMSKQRILAKKSVNSVLNERNLLSKLHHDFIVNMKYAFQDRENLYLIMDLLSGGDLRYHICKHRKFTEQQTKFFAANIILALEYLHNNSIIHRDIKPENLVFDDKGYLRVTDFGIARIWNPENKKDTSGTPGYMAPEVMCRQNHGVAVDYFALGVIVFECIFGFRPYRGKCRKEIRDQILAKQIKIKRHDIPPGWSVEACDFANRLLQRKPTARLGLNGPIEVKSHPWFDDFPWDKLEKKELQAPFVPDQVDNFDVKVTNDGWKDEDTDKMKESAILVRRDTVQDLFKGYYYDQSFEEFNFSLREAVKPLAAVVRRPAHRSCQLSPKRIVSNENENTFMKKQPFTQVTNSKAQEITERNNNIVYHQENKLVSQPENFITNQIPSRNIIIKNAALPKGPFHYRNESKKISQICSRSSTRRSTKSGSASQH